MILLQILNNFNGSMRQPAGTSCATRTDMSEKAEQLKKRTFRMRSLPATFEGRRVGGQLFDAG
jgi:hypothetical protein